MAHGGSAEWNSQVSDAIEPLRGADQLEIAFGMADAATIEDAVRRLEARGVGRVGVVRLFVSGESWYERTEQILGLLAGAPDPPADRCRDRWATKPEEHVHGEFWRIATETSFALSLEGLADAPEMGTVLADRALALSLDPAREDVLVLAHGPGDDGENARWLSRIDARADAVRRVRPFRRVRVATLREDWRDKRKSAEDSIRAYVARASAEGGRAIVIPFRVQGFGPYADVLRGLDYAADGIGLVPHAAVTDWISRQIESLRAGPFRARPRGS
jgi:sirohydrochlorin ferrochelatase